MHTYTSQYLATVKILVVYNLYRTKGNARKHRYTYFAVCKSCCENWPLAPKTTVRSVVTLHVLYVVTHELYVMLYVIK